MTNMQIILALDRLGHLGRYESYLVGKPNSDASKERPKGAAPVQKITTDEELLKLLPM